MIVFGINFTSHFISTYLYLHQVYSVVWQFIFNTFGPIYFVYYLHNDQIKNITLNYYFKLGLKKYINGHYYCKIFNSDKTNHLIHHGDVNEISKIDLSIEPVSIRRKNILLLNDKNPVQCDLDVLDNYVINMKKLNKSHTLKPKVVMKCLGLDCTDVQFITVRPFKKEVISIDQIDLDDLHISS
jgi:hypothetical protein